jgi:hypothetical protein
MKLSSLLHKLCKGDPVSIAEVNKKTGETIYEGKVCGIDRDDPINAYMVRHIFADGGVITAVVEKPRTEEYDEDRTH